MAQDPGQNTSTADGTESVDAGINAQDTNDSGTPDEDITGQQQTAIADDDGNDVDQSSEGDTEDVAVPDVVKTNVPISPFSQYAHGNAAEIAARVTAAAQNKHAGPGEPGDNFVAASTATVDVVAEQAALQALDIRRRAGADTSDAVAAYRASIQPLLNNRAPGPGVRTVALEPLAKVVTPIVPKK